MPCYQVRTISCKMESMNLDVLEAALKRAGFHHIHATTSGTGFYDANSDYYTLRSDGTLSTQSTRYMALEKTRGAVARAYAKESVITSAEALGWEWSENTQGQLEIIRGQW